MVPQGLEPLGPPGSGTPYPPPLVPQSLEHLTPNRVHNNLGLLIAVHVTWRPLLGLLSWYPPTLVLLLQLIWRWGSRRIHPQVPDLQLVAVTWLGRYGTRTEISVLAARVTCSFNGLGLVLAFKVIHKEYSRFLNQFSPPYVCTMN